MGTTHTKPQSIVLQPRSKVARTRNTRELRKTTDIVQMRLARDERDQLKKQGKWVEFLLLGSGESGKSTMMKQLRLIYGEGFTDAEKKDAAKSIMYNLLEGFAEVMEMMTLRRLNPTDAEVEMVEAMNIISQAVRLVRPEDGSRAESSVVVVNEKVVEAMKNLLNSASFVKAFYFCSGITVQEGWLNLAQKIANYPEWGGINWIPEAEDMLASRSRTTGIYKEYYLVDGMIYNFVDVGGQNTERRKWVQALNGIHCVLYLQALSEYDLTMFEDRTVNRLKDSLELFDRMVNVDKLSKSHFILFFNKFDLFQEKYYKHKTPIPHLFEDFEAPPKPEDEKNEKCELALAWFAKLFKSRDKLGHVISVHVVTAVDPDSMREAFESVSEEVSQTFADNGRVMVV